MKVTQCKKLLKKISIYCLLIPIIMICFSGCYDLAKFNELEDYYKNFGDVCLLNQKTTNSYSFEDYFYNKDSVNSFSGDIVEEDDYIYFVLPVKLDFNMAEFSMYMKSSNSGIMHYSIFITNSIPKKIRKYTDPKEKQKVDDKGTGIMDENGDPVMEQIEYDDLLDDSKIYSGVLNLAANKWDSFTMVVSKSDILKNGSDVVKKGNEYAINVTEGKYIIVKFENNSGVGFDKGYEKQSISITNILIRSI